MGAAGFPTLLSHNNMSAIISRLRRESETARIETVTGRIADLPQALGAQTGTAQLVRKSIEDLGIYAGTTANGLSRASNLQITLGSLNSGLPDLGASLLGAMERNDGPALDISATRASDALESAFSALNTRLGGTAFFAGDAVDQPALSDPATLIADISAIYAGAADAAQFQVDLDFYFDDPAGGFATNIYTGGAGDAPRITVSSNENADIGAKANEEPIRQLLRGLSTIIVAANTGQSTDRDAALSRAASDLFEADSGITTIRARIGIAEERLVNATDRISAATAALTETYNAMTGKDQFEAASHLRQLEVQLEASYTLTSRISQLSLVNYI